MTIDQAITFLEEMARYFQKKMVTTNEDMDVLGQQKQRR